MNDITGQLGSKVSQFVGVHVPCRREQLVIIHVGDQGFTNGIGYFKKNVAIALSLDQLPYGQTIFQRQGFEDISDVGRVKVFELALQLDEVLPVNQVFYTVLMLTFLTMGQVFNNTLALQQIDNLSQAILQAFLRFFYFSFGHRRTPLPAAEHAGRSIN